MPVLFTRDIFRVRGRGITNYPAVLLCTPYSTFLFALFEVILGLDDAIFICLLRCCRIPEGLLSRVECGFWDALSFWNVEGYNPPLPRSMPVGKGARSSDFNLFLSDYIHLVCITSTSIDLPSTLFYNSRQWRRRFYNQIFLPERPHHRLIFQSSSSCLSRNMNVRIFFSFCESLDGHCWWEVYSGLGRSCHSGPISVWHPRRERAACWSIERGCSSSW